MPLQAAVPSQGEADVGVAVGGRAASAVAAGGAGAGDVPAHDAVSVEVLPGEGPELVEGGLVAEVGGEDHAVALALRERAAVASGVVDASVAAAAIGLQVRGFPARVRGLDDGGGDGAGDEAGRVGRLAGERARLGAGRRGEAEEAGCHHRHCRQRPERVVASHGGLQRTAHAKTDQPGPFRSSYEGRRGDEPTRCHEESRALSGSYAGKLMRER